MDYRTQQEYVRLRSTLIDLLGRTDVKQSEIEQLTARVNEIEGLPSAQPEQHNEAVQDWTRFRDTAKNVTQS